MRTTKKFNNIKFSARLIRASLEGIASITNPSDSPNFNNLSIGIEDESWAYDSLEEFLSNYDLDDFRHIDLSANFPKLHLRLEIITFSYNGYVGTTVSLRSSSKDQIARALAYFTEAPENDKLLIQSTEAENPQIVVFIGHGRNNQWQRLRDHLRDKHGVVVNCYESGARAGHTIRDILEDMSETATIAFLVMTGEDKTEAKKLRARQNVIHECGLFQGKLGFNRGIMLVEQHVEMASNFDGIQQIRFKKNNIEETFGEVLATIRREFGTLS